MSNQGGKRPGAGRPQGRRNRRTEAQIRAVAEEGLTPLDYLLLVLRDEGAPAAERLQAARIAAPYVHPRLAMIHQVTVTERTHEAIAIEELDRRTAELAGLQPSQSSA
jgi:hypothetical protein